MANSTSSAEYITGYMLDTTEFNAVLNGELPISVLQGQRLFATHVQLDELEQTKCEQRRAKLRAVFEKIAPEDLSTASACWDVSKWDQSKWSDEDGIFEAMLARLQSLDKASPTRLTNQQRDILIAETAIKNRLVLVSGDAKLRMVTNEFGGHAKGREELFNC